MPGRAGGGRRACHRPGHRRRRGMLAEVQRQTVAEVVARIEDEARRVPGGAIAFDGDGTLWSGDVGEDFFEALLASNRLTAAAGEAFAREAERERIDAS